MIQLTNVFMSCLGIMGPAISDYSKRVILLYVIQLSGGGGGVVLNPWHTKAWEWGPKITKYAWLICVFLFIWIAKFMSYLAVAGDPVGVATAGLNSLAWEKKYFVNWYVIMKLKTKQLNFFFLHH